MDCLICFTLDISEYLIIAKNDIIHQEEVLIVKMYNSDYQQQESIVNLSPNLGEFFILNVEIIEYKRDLGKSFYLDEIFENDKKFEKLGKIDNFDGKREIFLKNDEETNQNLKKLTRYLILTSILIIIYCFVTMKIGIDNNEKIHQMILIKTQFIFVERSFYQMNNNVLNKVRIFDEKIEKNEKKRKF
jgi:hypothetical protein